MRHEIVKGRGREHDSHGREGCHCVLVKSSFYCCIPFVDAHTHLMGRSAAEAASLSVNKTLMLKIFADGFSS